MLAQSERAAEGDRLAALRDRLIEGLLSTVPGACLTGHPAARLPGHASFCLEGLTGESVLVELDMAGVACSSGSACRAGSTDPSHVLTAIGLSPEMARNGLRMTLGRENTLEDVEYLVSILPDIVGSIRTGAPAPA
jgi:cysteine desulfurase